MSEPGRQVPAGPEIERQIGTLALSQIEGAGSLALMRAVAWHAILAPLVHVIPPQAGTRILLTSQSSLHRTIDPPLCWPWPTRPDASNA